jgi:acyl-CoA reductase-like NAD-dependent aldehyde dehydrogenase
MEVRMTQGPLRNFVNGKYTDTRDGGKAPVVVFDDADIAATAEGIAGAGFFGRLPGHASVVTGGHAIGGPGYLFEPTVVSGLRQDDEMIQDEIFGPVITVQRFTDEDEAPRWANGVRYGLASSVDDYTRIKHVMSYIGA